jgi:hypothetical protein
MKTFARLLKTRPWIAHIDDKRGDGNSIIITLKSGWEFDDDPQCGVKGCDTVKEVEMYTRASNVEPTNSR